MVAPAISTKPTISPLVKGTLDHFLLLQIASQLSKTSVQSMTSLMLQQVLSLKVQAPAGANTPRVPIPHIKSIPHPVGSPARSKMQTAKLLLLKILPLTPSTSP